MKAFKKLSLTLRLLLTVVLVSTVISVVLGVVLIQRSSSESKVAMNLKVESIANFISGSASQYIWDVDYGPLNSIIKEAKKSKEIVYVQFFLKDKTPLTKQLSSEEALRKNTSVKFLELDITKASDDNQTEVLGFLRIGYSEEFINEQIKDSIMFGSIFVIFAQLLLALFLYFVVKGITDVLNKITKDIARATNETVSASEELATASTELSSGSTEQAASIVETTSSLEEISGMVENNVSNSEQAVMLSDTVLSKSKEANQSMEQLENSMSEILDSNGSIEELVKVIGNIGEKTMVMDEIVFQTKLLSFNASVEAERAGEHGRGFSVVAQEVGNLAQMSGHAAQEIAVIVKESIGTAKGITAENKKRVEQGNSFVVNTGKALKEIMESSTSVAQGSTQVLTASKDQSLGIRQIATAMNQLDKTTQENTLTAEKTAETSQRLNGQSMTLQDAVRELTELVEGQKDSY